MLQSGNDGSSAVTVPQSNEADAFTQGLMLWLSASDNTSTLGNIKDLTETLLC